MGPQLTRVSLAGIQQPVRRELDAVFGEIGRIIAADLPRINEVNAHLLRIKGKLLRPTLTLLAGQTTGTLGHRTVTLAAVVELIHLATLIHDDSVDHSVLRRGQPTVNALFSHQVAVIMGDYLYSRAIIELVAMDDLEPLRVLSRVTNEMTVGEMLELEAHGHVAFLQEDYDRLIDAKTASLMSGACEVGALDADAAQRRALRRYGRFVGLAFQITDDLLDYTETEAVTGKPVGHDLKEHKITLPLIAALPDMDRGERARVEALLADATPSDEAVAMVIEIVDARGGLEAARRRAREFAERAEAELESLPAGRARDALRDGITYAVERRS